MTTLNPKKSEEITVTVKKSEDIGKNYLLDCVSISSSHLPSCTKERNSSNSNLLERDRIALENGEVFIKFL